MTCFSFFMGEKGGGSCPTSKKNIICLLKPKYKTITLNIFCSEIVLSFILDSFTHLANEHLRYIKRIET